MLSILSKVTFKIFKLKNFLSILQNVDKFNESDYQNITKCKKRNSKSALSKTVRS